MPRAKLRPEGPRSLCLAGLPVELFPRKDGRSSEQRCPGAERSRDARVIDEVPNEPFDASTLEDENDGLFREKDAVAPKTGQSNPVRRSVGDDLGCPLP